MPATARRSAITNDPGTLDQGRLLAGLRALRRGDFTYRLPADSIGIAGEIAEAFNDAAEVHQRMSREFDRISVVVGRDGRISQRASLGDVPGSWAGYVECVNGLISDLTEPTAEVNRVLGAVARGDLSQRITLAIDGRPLKGEFLRSGRIVNAMVDQLNAVASEVTRVAREVGTEGKLGGQADVRGVAGTWRDLTDNVNQLAASLTTQLRAIGEVATAVTKGDLSRSIQVDAQGEVELLKDNINEMIGNLRDTTLKNTEQDWLKTNLARFTGMLQGQTDLQTVGRLILSELAPLVGVQHGVFCLNEPALDGQPVLNLLATYAYRPRETLSTQFKLGEGLVGQAAYERERILLTSVPADYVEIGSSLGQAPPLSIVVLPVLFEGDVKAVIELASFDRFSAIHLSFLDQLTESIGVVLNTLAANIRTENLLKQSQALTSELQQRQEELQQTNEALEEKARLLSEQNQEVERRRREIDEARGALEQKAEQLALTSKYKSQFLANMSHELRTPLNSLLILSQQLADNPDENLTAQQVEFAKTIRAAGNDLLTLINDILDLSKIESGTTALEVSPALLNDQVDDLERTFRQLAQQKMLAFTIELDPILPRTIRTDQTRLQQVLKNLLSNAFKFTDTGSVALRIASASRGWSAQNQSLSRARKVISFAVTDTGLGIPEEKHGLIFEAFQQADMDTSRRFGGTGLGLSISREIAGLLGGEITLDSTAGQGSTFTLFLPLAVDPASSNGQAEVNPPERSIATNRATGPKVAPKVDTDVDESLLLAPNEVVDDLALATDLADRAALALDNARLYGEAQQAIRIRNDFLSFASHDLKNPLTAIKGTADVLELRAKRSAEPEAQRSIELLGRISQTATRMAGLIDQIIDVAQLRDGQELRLERAPTNLVALAHRVVGDFQLNPTHVIEVEAGETELLGEWDAARIERVISNLVNNSIKYSPRGSRIAVSLCRESSADGAWAVLDVRDHGVGIPQDELPRVFDRYYRGRNVVGKVQGTGIGLAGVRQIIEQHGGQVTVTSAEGDGTTVCVRFPLVPAQFDQLESASGDAAGD